jgi:mono/diheme cytochrome c family protein
MAKHLLKIATAVVSATLLATLAGCMRGGTSHVPPIHIVQDMDFQPKLVTQAKVDFEGWSDHRAMRRPVHDAFGKTIVVAQGELPNPALAHRDANNAFVTQNPLPLDTKITALGRQMSVLERGQERFNIHCAICHGLSGQGGNDPKQAHGLVGRRWPVAIPNMHFVEGPGKDNRVPLMPDGEYFEVITYGKGTMPAYGARISPEDRWAIVHYVRALQSLSK